MATKQAARAFPEVPMDDLIIRIDGLTPVYGEDGLFKLSGAQRRPVPMDEILASISAIGDDEMADAISKAIWDVDLIRILKDRVRR